MHAAKMMWLMLLVIGLIGTKHVNAVAQDHNGNSLVPANGTIGQQDIQNGITSFTVNLFKLLYNGTQPGKNILFSPLNLYTSLAAIHLGSAGNTRYEITQVLGLPKDDTPSRHQTHMNFSKFVKRIQNSTKVTVDIANGIFVQTGFPINDLYAKATEALYSNEIQNVDFVNEKNSTLDTINNWIYNKTKGRITELFKEPFEHETVIALASSLYFNGNWKYKFVTAKTKTEKFKSTAEEEFDVQMMEHQKHVSYTNNSNLQYESISIPYEGDEYSMSIILPYVNTTIDTLINQLNVTTLQQLVTHSDEQTLEEVHYKVPKMKFNWKKDILQDFSALGIRDLFVYLKANLSNMIDSSDVFVSTVTHAADIDVHESGTVATSVTVFEFVTRIVGGHKRNAIQFYVNRPFIFFIHHHETKAILFTGLVRKPWITL